MDDDTPPASAYAHPDAVVQRWRVPDDADGDRADVYLARKVKRLSRSRCRGLIEKGDFRAATGALKPSSRLSRGTLVELWRFAPDEDDEPGQEPSVLFEDDDILLIDKPGDLAVHPSARYLRRTLTAWLKERAPAGERPARPCHRLDRETSGVLICAHSKRAEAAIKIAFGKSGLRKTYLAIVRGRLDDALTIDQPLALQSERGLVRIRMVADDAGAKAITDVEPLAFDDVTNRTLVRCRPRTGRQHQIRAHLAHAGWPIVGDKLYAMGDAWFDAFTRGDADLSALEHSRHALHALRLEFELDGRARHFEVALPAELCALVPNVDVAALVDEDNA